MHVKPRILVAPLDWGLGHATRCIPVIRELLRQGAEVVIGADKRPLQLLRKEFPGLEYIVMPGYGITYPRKGNMAVRMAAGIPRIVKGIQREHKQLADIVDSRKIEGVVSDNRFGLWTEKVPCAYITHQLHIKSPLLEHSLYKLNERYISKYDVCWVPDMQGTPNLSGELSHKKPLPENVRYVGPLSRFSGMAEKAIPPKYELVAIISGPEPQRTIFEELVTTQLIALDKKVLIVRGVTEEEAKSVTGKAEIVSHLGAQDMCRAIQSSGLVISRPGYSTIMDLAVLGKKAVFIPTPGQTEQEYLAEYHAGLGHCMFREQSGLQLNNLLDEAATCKGFGMHADEAVLSAAVGDFLNR